ncbi:hypothetical protein B2G71_01100 [Novosphingobium sp. PC22D]|uniref:glycosyltransferase n=1 Tax=Novosphingobium sp. PC22D TaxID=1962403 RepID=UPI000BF14717|nr:glycosyltransferase [Novosphingobium sp. PC22D]PEQ14235.1 hypothetical protein B2G71_01100 [Novosphingobium sp. PC22D]
MADEGATDELTRAGEPRVTVVVVARNEAQRIGACMASLSVQDFGAFETILVDDGSTDATVALARQALPSLRVISSPTRSISRNRDIGWRAGRGEFVAFLDADCIAPPHWLTSLVRAAERTGAAATGGGNVPPAETSPHYAALALMLDTFVGSRGSVQGKVPREGAFVAHLPGLNVLIRRDALEIVGGFDPRFARMGEDVDLSIRLRNLGFVLRVEPEATVIHRQRADLRAWTRNMRAYGRGRTWLLRRHPNAMSPLFLLPPLTLLALPVYVPAIAAYAGWVALRGGRPGLWPRVAALFGATHLAYGLGQIEGLFVRGDNREAMRRPRRLVVLAAPGPAADRAAIEPRLCEAARSACGVESGRCDVYLGTLGKAGLDLRPVPEGARARAMLIDAMFGSSAARPRRVGGAMLRMTALFVSAMLRCRCLVLPSPPAARDPHRALVSHRAD